MIHNCSSEVSYLFQILLFFKSILIFEISFYKCAYKLKFSIVKLKSIALIQNQQSFFFFKSSSLLLRGHNHYRICACISFKKKKSIFFLSPSLPLPLFLPLLPFLYRKICDAILAYSTSIDRAVFLYTLEFNVEQYFKA